MAGDFVVYSAAVKTYNLGKKGVVGTYNLGKKGVVGTVDSFVNSVVNISRHLKVSYKQMRSGHPIDAISWLYGTLGTVFGGDMLDKKNPVSADATAISMNGIFNDDIKAKKMRDIVSRVLKRKTHAVKNGTHFFGIGDLIQCIVEGTGGKTIADLNVADSVNEMGRNHPNKKIYMIIHSQAGSSSSGGSTVMLPEIKRRMSVFSFGAQLAPSEKSNGFGFVYNERASGGWWGGDPVPYLDPRNYVNWLFGNNIYNNPTRGGHSFKTNYGEKGIQRGLTAERNRKP